MMRRQRHGFDGMYTHSDYNKNKNKNRFALRARSMGFSFRRWWIEHIWIWPWRGPLATIANFVSRFSSRYFWLNIANTFFIAMYRWILYMFSRIEICFVCARYKNKKSIEIAINGMLSERAGETEAEQRGDTDKNCWSIVFALYVWMSDWIGYLYNLEQQSILQKRILVLCGAVCSEPGTGIRGKAGKFNSNSRTVHARRMRVVKTINNQYL